MTYLGEFMLTSTEEQYKRQLGDRLTENLETRFAIKPSMPFERVMGFIDGNYLRKRCRDSGGHDNISWGKL